MCAQIIFWEVTESIFRFLLILSETIRSRFKKVHNCNFKNVWLICVSNMSGEVTVQHSGI